MKPAATLLHSVASWPVAYDVIQWAVGAPAVNRALRAELNGLRRTEVLVDVGGGTGLSDDLGLEYGQYICVDNDQIKLNAFQRKHPRGQAVRADARRLPIAGGVVDLVMCKSVSHHLDDSAAPQFFEEAARVLKPGGRFVFVDAVAAPSRLRSRLLWRYDRGAFPRDVGDLRAMFERFFDVLTWTTLAIHHVYVIGVGAPRRLAD